MRTPKDWHVFLDDIAVQVDKLLLKAGALDTFRQRIQPFRERWERHYDESRRRAQVKLRHWEAVKRDARLRDKAAGPPRKGWEWDRDYVAQVDLRVGAVYEIPPEHVPGVIAAAELRIERVRSQMEKHSESSAEYRRLADYLPVFEQDLVDLHAAFDGLGPAERAVTWIKTPERFSRTGPGGYNWAFLWFRLVDVDEGEIFGCWRPPLKTIPEHPCNALIPEENTRRLPRSHDRTEEYERYYVSLASIHDNVLSGCESITKPVWPMELAKEVWVRFSKAQPYGPDQAFIETALNRVQADLRKLERESNGAVGWAGETQGKALDKLADRIRAYVREGEHRRELREAVERAKRERPDILDWLEPYQYRLLKDIGLYEDNIPSPSLSEVEALLLKRVLVAIAHDVWMGPDEAKIAYDWYARADDPEDQFAGHFGESVYRVGTALAENELLQKRVADALAALAAESPKEADHPGRVEEDEVRYSLEEGFTGITDKNKAIWAKRYPHIKDFDREVKETEEFLRQHPAEAEKACARPRLRLDHYFSPESEWIPIGGQTSPEMAPETFAELADRIETRLDPGFALTLDGKRAAVTPLEYGDFRFEADRLRKLDPHARALPEPTREPTVDMVYLMEYCQEEAKRQLGTTGGAENGEMEERSNKQQSEQERLLSSGTPRGKPEQTDCTHSGDFSSVVWYGVPHHFTATQALCVALFWAEWEKNPEAKLGLREKSIGEKIGSSNENYRLAHTFRQQGKRHSAWGTMIHAKGDGFFYLAPPLPAKRLSKKRKK